MLANPPPPQEMGTEEMGTDLFSYSSKNGDRSIFLIFRNEWGQIYFLDFLKHSVICTENRSVPISFHFFFHFFPFLRTKTSSQRLHDYTGSQLNTSADTARG